MRAGRLRQTIGIKAPLKTKNELGETLSAWADFATAWSEAKPISSSKRFVSNHLKTEVNFQFRIRFIDGINHQMKVFYNGREFDIDSVLNVGERNEELIILASEVM